MALEALVCPNCKGEVELDKDQEFGYCKYCGTKVQNASIKHIRGRIKIDKNNDLDNYYIIARRSIGNGDDKTAEKYYDMILQIDPNSYEALFYNTYCNARNCKIIEIRSSIIKLNNCLDSVFKLMSEQLEGDELEKKITEIGNRANNTFITLVDAYRNHYLKIDYRIKNRYTQQYLDTVLAGIKAEEYLSALLLKYFPDSKWVKNNVGTLLGNANLWHVNCIPLLAQKDLNIEKIHKRTERIKQFKPDYVEPKIRKSGCYVATCVYGSYDCPQVWTLRRYRDYNLAKSWYGRSFIRMYYALSPTIVKIFGDTKIFKKIWKRKLDNMVVKLQEKGYEKTPYDDLTWK